MTVSERSNCMSGPEIQNTLTTGRDQIAASGLRRHKWQLLVYLKHNGSFPCARILQCVIGCTHLFRSMRVMLQ